MWRGTQMSIFVIWSQAWNNACLSWTLENLGKFSATTLSNYHWSKRENWRIHSDTIQKIGKKLNGKELKRLARFYTFLILEGRTTLMKAFIESQFAYCPFFFQRSSNTRINHPHERASKIVYNDVSTLEDLLKKGYSVSIHHKNIPFFGIELYKVKNNLSTHLMSEVFNPRNIGHKRRSQSDLKQYPVNTVDYGLTHFRPMFHLRINQVIGFH